MFWKVVYTRLQEPVDICLEMFYNSGGNVILWKNSVIPSNTVCRKFAAEVEEERQPIIIFLILSSRTLWKIDQPLPKINFTHGFGCQTSTLSVKRKYTRRGKKVIKKVIFKG